MIAAQLRGEQLPLNTLGALNPDQVGVARTASRHVLGVMNDVAAYTEAALASAGGLATCDLERLNHSLRRGLHQRDGHYVTPLDLVAERLHRPPR